MERKNDAGCEDRTHDLRIMRPTRYRLRQSRLLITISRSNMPYNRCSLSLCSAIGNGVLQNLRFLSDNNTKSNKTNRNKDSCPPRRTREAPARATPSPPLPPTVPIPTATIFTITSTTTTLTTRHPPIITTTLPHHRQKHQQQKTTTTTTTTQQNLTVRKTT